MRCSVEGCTSPYRSRGFCHVHRREALLAGGEVPDFRKAGYKPNLTVPCKVDGCDNESRYRGQALCGLHYQRFRDHGSPDLPARPTLRETFYASFEVNEAGCWIWVKSIANTGYGRIGALYAHRVSHELHIGVIPDRFQVDHLCRVRTCVNPEHLEAVTQQENLRRERLARMERNSPEQNACPECRAGSHRNCDGTTWDRATEALVTCPCFAAAVEAGEDHPGRFERNE